jgi:hypothetical protein
MKSLITILVASNLIVALLNSAIVRPEAAEAVAGITITVNSTADLPDALPGNGLCEATAGQGNCTLRAATMEANANSNPSITIIIPAGIYRISIPPNNPEDDGHGSIKIRHSLTITGAGSRQTTVDVDGHVIHDRTLEIISSTSNSTITIQGLTIQEGNVTTAQPTGPKGGGMYVKLGNEAGVSGSLTLKDVVFKLNSAQGVGAAGGGLYLEGWGQSSFSLSNVTISNNTVASDSFAGAGLQFESGDYNLAKPYSSLVIQNSYIANNKAVTLTNGNPWGGGIDIRHGKVTLVGSTLANNQADQGGGISLDGVNSVFNLINSTLSGNQANLNGGGVYAVNGVAALASMTIMSNNADDDLNGSGQGGGIYQTGSSSVTLANSLVAYNHETTYDPIQQIYVPSHGDLRGFYTSEGYNGFVDTLDSTFSGLHNSDRYDITYTLIGSLDNNGGDTPTRALLAGSEAINAGNPAGCNDPTGSPLTSDQRGFMRVIFGRCDIGAYELGLSIYLPIILR